MALVLLLPHGDGRLADTACWRRCHASIKSRQTSPTGDERQNKSRSDRRSGRQPQRESARRRSGPSPPRRTSPTTRITTASLKAAVTMGGWSGPSGERTPPAPAFAQGRGALAVRQPSVGHFAQRRRYPRGAAALGGLRHRRFREGTPGCRPRPSERAPGALPYSPPGSSAPWCSPAGPEGARRSPRWSR